MEKQAILLMVHSFKENVKNLLKELDYENFDIFIHIDKKSKIINEDFQNICTKSHIYIYIYIKKLMSNGLAFLK